MCPPQTEVCRVGVRRNAKRCAPRIEVPANCATVHLRLQLRETARGLVGISTQRITVTFSDGHGDSVPVIASAGLPRLQMNAELGELETVRVTSPLSVMPAGVRHSSLSNRRISNFGIVCARLRTVPSSTLDEQPLWTGELNLEFRHLCEYRRG